jgi:hypothetical protein
MEATVNMLELAVANGDAAAVDAALDVLLAQPLDAALNARVLEALRKADEVSE